MKKFKIGFLPLTKQNWTNAIMQAQREQACKMLSAFENVELVGGGDMIETEAQACEILKDFERERPDIVVAFFATFALGTIVPLFAKTLNVPVVLWSQPEPDPQGGRLRANSFCAANMNSHFMWRFHVPYFHVHGAVDARETIDGIDRAIRVVRGINAVRKMRIGSIGGRVPGFYTSCCSEMLLRDKIGAEVKFITLLEVVEAAKKMPKEKVDEALALIKGDATCIKTSEENLRKSAAFFAAVREMKGRFGVDTFTVRCWPEIIADDLYGMLACSTIGHLTNHGDLTVCEGDVYAAVMLRLEEILSGENPFFCDMIYCEEKCDYSVFWHCGAAPCSLCKTGAERVLNNSSTVPTKGVINEFPLKEGRVTVARLGEKRDGSGFRMLIMTGTGLDTDMFVRGNPLKVKFDAGNKRVHDVVFYEGFEHHFSLAYGDLTEELTAFCRAMDIEPIIVK